MELVGVFYDEGTSGTTTMHRDGFNKMLKLARKGEIDIILTKEVSRFARNTVDTLKITRELKQTGVGVIFINDNIDTRESDGELRLSIMATIAQEESRKISERVRWGQARKMEQGVVFGRNCLGYDVSGGKISIEKRGASIVQRIFNEYTLLLKGAGTIAKELNSEKVPAPCAGSWSASYIRRILRNEKYVGDLEQKKSCTPDYLTHKKKLNRGGRIYLRCHHEPIISRELWDMTQLEISRRTPTETSRNSDRYPYSGKVHCALCGCVMVSRVKKLNEGIYKALRCAGRIKGNGCDNDTLNVKVLTAGIKYMLDGIAKVTERRKMAADIITSVTQRLRSGWNPWAELSNSRQYAKVDDVINIYVKYLKKLHAAGSIKDSTLTDYNKRLRVLCDYMQNHTLPIMYIYQFNLSYISDFLDYLLLDRDSSARTRNNYKIWLSSFCSWLVEKQ